MAGGTANADSSIRRANAATSGAASSNGLAGGLDGLEVDMAAQLDEGRKLLHSMDTGSATTQSAAASATGHSKKKNVQKKATRSRRSKRKDNPEKPDMDTTAEGGEESSL